MMEVRPVYPQLSSGDIKISNNTGSTEHVLPQNRASTDPATSRIVHYL